MNEVGTDLFDAIGKKWIVLVDRYSGYAWTQELRRTDTATVTGQLSEWFTEFGWPSAIRTAHNSDQNLHNFANNMELSTSSLHPTNPSQTG